MLNTSDIVPDIIANGHEDICLSTVDFTNGSDAVIADAMFYSPLVRILVSFILPIILIIGLLGNLSFLVTILRVQSMRTITNAYLASLSMADFSFTVFIGFRYIWTISNSPYVYTNPFTKDAGCVLMAFVSYLTYFTSITLVFLVSYERYLAVCHPLDYKSFKSKGRTTKMICVTWGIAAVLAASITPTSSLTTMTCVIWPDRKQYSELPTVLHYCTSVSRAFWNYAYLLQAACFLIAFCTNVVLYSLIINTLARRNTFCDDTNNLRSQMSSRIQKGNTVVARMLVVNAVAYFICLTPFQLYGLQSAFEELSEGRLDLLTRDQSSTLVWVATTMNCVNSATNPIIYNVFNVRYRRALFKAFRFGRLGNHKSVN